MKAKESYMDTLIGALRQEARKDFSDDIGAEAFVKLFSDLVANALALSNGNMEMLYTLMLVLNSFLKEQRENLKGAESIEK